MSGHTWVAIPHAALRVAGAIPGRRLGVLDLYERADAVRYGWLTWTERELADAWGVHRRVVASLLADLESAGLIEVDRAAPRTRAPSRLRVFRVTREPEERVGQSAGQNYNGRKPVVEDSGPVGGPVERYPGGGNGHQHDMGQKLGQSAGQNYNGRKPVVEDSGPVGGPEVGPTRASLIGIQTSSDVRRTTTEIGSPTPPEVGPPDEPADRVAPAEAKQDRPPLALVVPLQRPDPPPAPPSPSDDAPTLTDAVPPWAKVRGAKSIEVFGAVVRAIEAIRQEPVKPNRCATDAKQVLSLWKANGSPPLEEFAAEVEIVAQWAQASADPLAENDIRGIRPDGAQWGPDRSRIVATICRQDRWADRLAAARRWASGAGPPGAYVRGAHPGETAQAPKLDLTPEQRERWWE